MNRRSWLAGIAAGTANIALTGCSTALSAFDGTRHLGPIGWEPGPVPPTPKGFTVRAEEVVAVASTWHSKERHQLYADRRCYYIVGDFQKLTGANSWIARRHGTRIDGRDRAAFEAWAARARTKPSRVTPQQLQTPARSTSS